jgi:hypothetical protein
MTPEPLPTFVILGAQKSGTRWLRVNLGLHPEVFTAASEIGFFSGAGKYAEGAQWYATQFEGWAGERIVGEATPAYMMYRHDPTAVASRIGSFNHEMRLLAVLRNPVERAHSAFVHHRLRGRIEPGIDLLEHVRRTPPTEDRLNIVAGGWYHASLLPFWQEFGDQLLVVMQDDVRTRPEVVYDRALAHVGASPGFRPPDFGTVLFSNRPQAERRAGPEGYGQLTDTDRAELYEYFRDDIARLEAMLGRSLDHWKLHIDPARGLGDR